MTLREALQVVTAVSVDVNELVEARAVLDKFKDRGLPAIESIIALLESHDAGYQLEFAEPDDPFGSMERMGDQIAYTLSTVLSGNHQ